MVWLAAPAKYVKGHYGPYSDVYQARYPIIASINACLKLGWELGGLPVSCIRDDGVAQFTA